MDAAAQRAAEAARRLRRCSSEQRTADVTLTDSIRLVTAVSALTAGGTTGIWHESMASTCSWRRELMAGGSRSGRPPTRRSDVSCVSDVHSSVGSPEGGK